MDNVLRELSLAGRCAVKCVMKGFFDCCGVINRLLKIMEKFVLVGTIKLCKFAD